VQGFFSGQPPAFKIDNAQCRRRTRAISRPAAATMLAPTAPHYMLLIQKCEIRSTVAKSSGSYAMPTGQDGAERVSDAVEPWISALFWISSM